MVGAQGTLSLPDLLMVVFRVSYDDGETLALKTQFANNRCLAGKMIWAVDLDEAGSPTLKALVSGSRWGNGGGGVGGLPGDIFGDLPVPAARRAQRDIRSQNEAIRVRLRFPTNLVMACADALNV